MGWQPPQALLEFRDDLRQFRQEVGQGVKRGLSEAERALSDAEKAIVDRKNFLCLTVVKVLGGGLVVGFLSSRLLNKPLLGLVALDMAFGLGESLLSRKLFDDKSKVSRSVLQWLQDHVEKNPKPVSALSREERQKLLTPVSAIVTALSALLTATVGYFLPNRGHGHVLPSLDALRQQVTEAQGMKRLLAHVKVGLKRFGDWAPIRFVKQNPLLSVLAATAVGMSVGWLEGVIAKKAGEAG